MTAGRAFPFSAVVGQADAQLALLLVAVDPAIGGVLLRGDKGSAKSTLARGLAALLPGGAPFVELPVGATEDRVLGGLDVGAALGEGATRLRPGLLTAAHGGVLYVDEVNLLPDHLVDVLLDAAASGVHRVERDGVSETHPARFVLIGSMNPEEGELRPQLLDRFGLAVDVKAPSDPALRAEAVRRRIAHDAGTPANDDDDGNAGSALAARLAACGVAALPDEVVTFASRLALAVGAEGLRADLVLCRAARALAAWEGRAEATTDDVQRVAPLALAHRRRRRPFDPPALPPEELAAALREAKEPRPSTSEEVDGSWCDAAASVLEAPSPSPVALAQPPRTEPATGPQVRGVTVGDRAPGPHGPSAVAVAATVRTALGRGARTPDAADVREPVRRRPATRTVILTVDTSGSMGSRERVEAAAGAVLALLADAYRSRHRVALVTFRGRSADVVLAPTASVEVARARLADLPTGGATPVAEALAAAADVAGHRRCRGPRPGPGGGRRARRRGHPCRGPRRRGRCGAPRAGRPAGRGHERALPPAGRGVRRRGGGRRPLVAGPAVTAADALLLVGHGSRSAEAAAEMGTLAGLVAAAVGPATTVDLGFLEMTDPPAEPVLDRLVAAGARSIAVQPLMLLGAGHTKSDVPALVLAGRQRHPGVQIVLGTPLGVARDLVAVLGEAVVDAGGEGLPLLMIARGTSDPDANGDACKAGRLVGEWTAAPFVHTAFSGVTGPAVPEGLDVMARLGHRRFAVVFWFLCSGLLVDRARAQIAAFAATTASEVVDAGYLGPDPRLVPLIVERALALAPSQLNCDLCAYRAPWPGREDRLARPIGLGHSHLAAEHRH